MYCNICDRICYIGAFFEFLLLNIYNPKFDGYILADTFEQKFVYTQQLQSC